MSDLDYYKHIRYDVLAHVPKGIRRALTIGCGEGHTEAQLVSSGVEVFGVELNPEAAKAAAGNGIKILCGDALKTEIAPGEIPFDCLIYADVLEHMADPETVLRGHVKLLAPGGVVVVSVPNFRHYSVLSQLFWSGHIRYTEAGILDRTHLRITTRRLIEEWFAGAGLTVTEIDYRIPRRRDRLISTLSFGLLREFLASQVIIVGRGGSASPAAKPVL